MNLSNSSLQQKRQIVGFFELTCQELELTDSMFQDARQKYEAVGKWLDDGDTIQSLGPRIIPQGSISLGTTVRPIGRDEFDIDLVCKLLFSTPGQNPSYIMRLVGNRLRANKTYEDMLEPLKRGWRLNYARSSKFHLDITPAVPKGETPNGEIYVPDREQRQWKPSNPEGYVKWFEGHASLKPTYSPEERMRLLAGVAPLPEPTPFNSVLKRAVQIFKRHRDVYFQSRNRKDAPISIIITTLAAKSYAAAVQNKRYDSQFDLLFDVVSGLHRFITVLDVSGKPFYFIPNETTKGENFAEKWNKHPERSKAFYEWQGMAQKDMERLGGEAGLDTVRMVTMGMLGEKEVSKAFNRYTEAVNRSRTSGELKINALSGLGISGGVPVKRNTFFGK